MKNNLRTFGKKNRSAITLDIESKASLSIQIKYCLDKIFFLNRNIKTASIYYPINNEITPFDFTKYFKERKIVMSMPVVDIKKKSIKEAQNEIKEIISGLENKDTILDKSIDKYQRMLDLNYHIQEEFKKKAKQINTSNLTKDSK